jgi:hypothetical protein
MLRHIPMDEQVLRKWLKVGFVKRNGSPRKAGRRKAELLHRRWQTWRWMGWRNVSLDASPTDRRKAG